jgi:hypothetical protein
MSGFAAIFNPAEFGPVFGPLLAVERLPELGPGTPAEEQRARLEEAARSGFAHVVVRQPLAAKAFMAGLWLMFDLLDDSHDISQSLPDEWGAYWHGIMHRREPDPGNAAYWFRRVHRNPILPTLQAAARESAGYDYRDPFAFIDDCERLRGSGKDLESRLRIVQRTEIRMLLKHDFETAVG